MITRRIAALALGTGLLLGGAAAPAAHAAAPPSASRIVQSPPRWLGSCTPLQDGRYKYYMGHRYQCQYVTGFGGFYWVLVANSCTATAAPAARETAAC